MSAIQIKNVPEDLHAELRARAEGAGVTLSEYLLDALRRDLRRPRTAAWLDTLASRPMPAGESRLDGAAEVRAARRERERELDARSDRITRAHRRH